MRLPIYCALIGGIAFGQQPEIQGVVLELPYDTPVAGADVSVDQVRKTTTDINGQFRLGVSQLGSLLAQVQKEGYLQVPAKSAAALGGREVVTVTADHSTVALHVIRTSEVTGTVLDEETNEPVAGLAVLIMAVEYQRGQRVPGEPRVAITDMEGHFSAVGLYPGEVLLSIRATVTGSDRFETQFSAEDVKVVDREYGSGYWPGGPDLELASPIKLIPGAALDVGTWRLRKIPLFRVHVSVGSTNCAPEDPILVRPYSGTAELTKSEGGGTVPCGKDLLLTHYPPSHYSLELSVNRQPRTAGVTVPFEVHDSNLDLKVELQRAQDLEGRIVAADGAKIPRLDTIHIGFAALTGFTDTDIASATPDDQGRFRFTNVRLGMKKLFVFRFGNGLYVKEVRYNGSAINANIFEWNGVGALEIVMDDKPATISGTVLDRDKPVRNPDVVLVKWPAYPENPFQSVMEIAGDGDGKFQFPDLAPGEYRIFALSQDTQDKLNEPPILERMLRNAEKVTLERAGDVNLSLRLSDPSR